MKFKTTTRDLPDRVEQAVKDILLGVAVIGKGILSQYPPKPARGSFKFASEKQRRFVMAGKEKGTIQVPYRRGSASGKSETLGRSLRFDLVGLTSIVSSGASYAKYVLDENEQAQIHRNRWLTNKDATAIMIRNDSYRKVMKKVINAMKKGRGQ
jgi:hypothetical protein